MKKSTPWAEHHNDAEREIRADERAKVLAEFSKSQRECYEFASKIMQRMAAYQPAKHESFWPPNTNMGIPTTVAEKPTPKRKATTANQEQIEAALTILRNVRPPDEPLTPKQVDEGTGIGLRTVGAALRELIKQGLVLEVKRGKFKAVEMKKEVGNGVGEANTATR